MKSLLVAVIVFSTWAIGYGQSLGNNPMLLMPTNMNTTVVERGGDFNVWETSIISQTADSRNVTNNSRYTEMASGMNFWNGNHWQASSEEVVPLATGGGAATNGQHRVYFPFNIYNGAVGLVTPDGIKLQARPLCISYFDGTNNVLLASLTNSHGAILPSANQVIYPDAFDNVNADVLCTYKRLSFESDLIFRENPPSPAEFGLDTNSTRVQLWTEFFSTNLPSASFDLGDTNIDNDPILRFGQMKLGHGKAFLMGNPNTSPSGISAEDVPGIQVHKIWQTVENRRFLIEEVPYWAIQSAFDSLATNNVVAKRTVNTAKKSSDLAWLPEKRSILVEQKTPPMVVANTVQRPGFVLDYVALNSYTNNYRFRSDTTYFITGPVSLAGNSNVFEGGTVIKFTNNPNAMIIVNTSNIWQTDVYHPVIFTSWNDDTVGTILNNFPLHSGSPSTLSAVTYLFYNYGSFPGNQIKYAKFKYAGIAVKSFSWLAVWHSQFVYCGQALRPMAYFDPIASYHPYWGVGLFNDLFDNCQTAVELDDGGYVNTVYPTTGVTLYLDAQNTTVGQATHLFALAPATFSGCYYGCTYPPGMSGGCGSGGFTYPTYIATHSQAFLTNCLFTSVSDAMSTYLPNTIGSSYGLGNYGAMGYPYADPHYGSAFAYSYQLATSPYISSAAGNYYLPTGSSYKTAAINSIQTQLQADLQHKTTDMPAIPASPITSFTQFDQSQVNRDTGITAVGYHYDPIDYLVDQLSVNNATLYITNGAVLAFGNGLGVNLIGNSTLVSQGTPNQRDYFVHYSAVQEQAKKWGGNGNAGVANTLPFQATGTSTPLIILRLSTLIAPSSANYILNQPSASYNFGSLRLQDCEVFGAGSQLVLSPASGSTVAFTNSLFQYCNTTVEGVGACLTYNNTFTVPTNNPVFLAKFKNDGTGTWVHADNAYDNVQVYLDGTYSHSAYLNGTTLIAPLTAKTGDIGTGIVGNNQLLSWVKGPLGNFYQPNASPLSPLIYAGSRLAWQAGLYHYTVTTTLVGGSEVPEGLNTVSIGYHYLAIDANGNPIDSNNDGTPDYMSDVNGDGMDDSWELQYFGTVNVDPNADPNGDNLNNLQDFLLGLDPRISINGLTSLSPLDVFTPLKH